MNESLKSRIDKLDKLLVEKLSSIANVYQDSVSEDEFNNECRNKYHYFIFETGGMQRVEEKQFTLIQDVLVRYYAEGVENVDHAQIDVISTLEKSGYTFISSNKTAIRKGEEDTYIDEIEFNFTRSFKYVC